MEKQPNESLCYYFMENKIKTHDLLKRKHDKFCLNIYLMNKRILMGGCGWRVGLRGLGSGVRWAHHNLKTKAKTKQQFKKATLETSPSHSILIFVFSKSEKQKKQIRNKILG